MISKNMVDMLNEQINMELYSGYLYMDIANYYAQKTLEGFSHWFLVQAKEEYSHAMRIREYLLDNGKELKLDELDNPTIEYKNALEPLETALDHEKDITESIHKIYKEAVNEEDYRTMEFLNWFIEEQLEEEANVGALVDKYNLFSNDGKMLYMLDREFALREE